MRMRFLLKTILWIIVLIVLTKYVFFPKKEIILPPSVNTEIRNQWNDANGNHMLHSFIWPSSQVMKPCLATHTTVDGLHWLVYQAIYYQGPISVAVYTPGKDVNIAAAMITYLRKCYSDVRNWVSFHILYPTLNEAEFTDLDELMDVPSSFPCGEAEEYNRKLLINRSEADVESCKLYPQNVARNLAWDACGTSFVLNADIDMIPNYGLSQMLEEFFTNRQVCEERAYILPVYEVQNNTDFPVRDKRTMLSLIQDGLARVFHIEVFKENQGNSDLKKWEKITNGKTFDVMYSIEKYKLKWEPIMVLHSSAPRFLEQFIGYGSTRSSHVFLLNFKRFHFKVLSKAFLTHRGFQTTEFYPDYRTEQIEKNYKLFEQYQKELYPPRRKRKRRRRRRKSIR